MLTASSSFMAEETGVCVLLALHHRTTVVSIEVELLAPPLSRAESSSFVVWALTVPRRERSFADGFYTVAVPVPLGCVSYKSAQQQKPQTAVLSLGRWELYAGTRVALVLAPLASSADAVRHTLEEALRTKRSLPPPKDESEQHAALPMPAAHWRLCGSVVVTSGPAVGDAEWQPLLHRRWYELKSYVRQGTAAPYFSNSCHARRTDGTASDSDEVGRSEGQGRTLPEPMYAGDVREADAISVNRHCVLWADGGVGLYDEVKPFFRVYQPARPEKTIRVRRFPHRYADVIGEIPFGQCVEAFGRAIDSSTQEQYVLLYLPAGEAFAHHVATYDLTFVEDGRYVWGWSKLAGSSGLPLLTERRGDETTSSGLFQMAAPPANTTTTAPAAAGASFTSTSRTNAQEASSKTEVMQLPERTFYTPVREGRAVRIRKRPTLTAATLREMEANEVRAASALLTVPLRLPSDPTGAAVPHVFVQWQHGGYSLLRNEVECFLVPVLLSRVPRRFPLRTRSSGGGDDDAAQEVVDLSRQCSRKRRRNAESSEDGDTDAELEEMLRKHKKPTAAAAASDDSLLSPCSLPASLREGLRKGVVRLEDLPPLCKPSDEDEEEADDSDTSSCAT
ncbi:hypothetical protein ABL78_4139 [Leptomonas seymouri]|uniref:Uncharacterized protein n=1 Tax=Leptomonas seymouri TaxID=5684 RepID=A0A0N1I592_LEPSE|nr:hypothetical protein ABL78_4139 [Leptomonas seymouri]|eukprot:KPI86815.1 hypothetical protein ABL78_4139 [Leptomonas seymouri]